MLNTPVIEKKKKIIIALVLFVSISATFGILCTNWWLTGDDFHGIYLGFKANSWKSIIHFFIDGNTNQGLGQAFCENVDKPSFFNAYYRPLYCIFLALQYKLFNLNIYGFFLCNTLAHACNSAVLFYIFTNFTTIYGALAAALIFAIHPQIGLRFGAIVNFHYYINVTWILLIALLFKHYVTNKKKRYLYGALGLYAISLLTRETTIVLPIIITSWHAFFAQTKNFTCLNAIKNIPLSFKKTFGFWLLVASFLFLRAYLYPIVLETNSVCLPYIANKNFITHKTQELLMIFYDFFTLSWVPYGNRIIKMIFIIPTICFLIICWLKNSMRWYIIWCFASTIAMLWPGLISYYSHRYLYEAYPFWLLGIILLIHNAELITIHIKKAILFICFAMLIFYAYLTNYNFKMRNTKMKYAQEATTNLVKTLQKTNRPIFFIGIPRDGFDTCFAHDLFAIIFNNSYYPAFADASLFITQIDSNIVETKYFANVIAPYYHENYYSIVPTPEGIRIISHDVNKIHFYQKEMITKTKIGTKTINFVESYKGQKVATDITLSLSSDFMALDPIFIHWDYTKQQFKLLVR